MLSSMLAPAQCSLCTAPCSIPFLGPRFSLVGSVNSTPVVWKDKFTNNSECKASRGQQGAILCTCVKQRHCQRMENGKGQIQWGANICQTSCQSVTYFGSMQVPAFCLLLVQTASASGRDEPAKLSQASAHMQGGGFRVHRSSKQLNIASASVPTLVCFVLLKTESDGS